MSMHKTPLTELERSGLERHRLPIGAPSQLSDCFRLGMAYSTAPLLAEIERLKDSLRRHEVVILKAIEPLAQASNAQAEPLALERLSISEAKTIVSQHVEGEMTGDDWTIINAVQSAIAAKNGATLK